MPEESNHGEIPVPAPSEGGTNPTEGEEEMAEPVGNEPDGDLSNDSLELLTEAHLQTWDNLMAESAGNIQGASSIVRYSAARKFNQEDPIEAAATEMILQKNT